MLAFLTLSSNIAHLLYHPSCQVSVGKSIEATKRVMASEPSQSSGATPDKLSLALANGLLIYILEDKMKEHQKASGVKMSL